MLKVWGQMSIHNRCKGKTKLNDLLLKNKLMFFITLPIPFAFKLKEKQQSGEQCEGGDTGRNTHSMSSDL